MMHLKSILVDVDGVLATFVDDLFKSIGSPRRIDSVTRWDFISELVGEEKRIAQEVLHDHNWWRTLGLVEGAQTGIETLRKRGRVKFVTSPYHSCREWEHARREWLKRYFDAHPSKDVHVTGEKHDVAGLTLIDDKFEHCDDWRNARGESVILFDAPYNTAAPDSPDFQGASVLRALGWKKVPELLEIIHPAVSF